MDGGASWATVHGVAKSRRRLSDFTLTFHFHALEKEMATHSSIFSWKIPWTEEPGQATVLGAAKSQTRRSARAHTHTERVSMVARGWKSRGLGRDPRGHRSPPGLMEGSGAGGGGGAS